MTNLLENMEFDLQAFSQRLAIAYEGDTIKTISDKSGVPKSSCQKYLAAEVEPRASTLISLARGAEVDLVWLATGLGQPRHDQVVDNDFISIPYVPNIYIGDAQRSFHDGCKLKAEGIKFSRAWIDRFLSIPPENLYCICVEGDAMEPTLRNYNLLIVERSPAEASTREGLHLIYYARKIAVRRLESRADRVHVKPDNIDIYGSFEVPYDELFDIDEALENSTKYGIFGRIVFLARNI